MKRVSQTKKRDQSIIGEELMANKSWINRVWLVFQIEEKGKDLTNLTKKNPQTKQKGKGNEPQKEQTSESRDQKKK